MHAHPSLAAAFVFLVSFYKPLILFVTFVPWAWLVSSKLEKDARKLKLNYHQITVPSPASALWYRNGSYP